MPFGRTSKTFFTMLLHWVLGVPLHRNTDTIWCWQAWGHHSFPLIVLVNSSLHFDPSCIRRTCVPCMSCTPRHGSSATLTLKCWRSLAIGVLPSSMFLGANMHDEHSLLIQYDSIWFNHLNQLSHVFTLSSIYKALGAWELCFVLDRLSDSFEMPKFCHREQEGGRGRNRPPGFNG